MFKEAVKYPPNYFEPYEDIQEEEEKTNEDKAHDGAYELLNLVFHRVDITTSKYLKNNVEFMKDKLRHELMYLLEDLILENIEEKEKTEKLKSKIFDLEKKYKENSK